MIASRLEVKVYTTIFTRIRPQDLLLESSNSFLGFLDLIAWTSHLCALQVCSKLVISGAVSLCVPPQILCNNNVRNDP